MKKLNLTWFDIVRLGLVQTALGSMVVLVTSVLNRVMVVELALAASVPGALVALHYIVQLSRPKWGYSSDMSGRRVPWIIGGIIILGLGTVMSALAVVVLDVSVVLGSLLLITAFMLIGAGVAIAGTSLLAFLAVFTEQSRKPAAAATVWLMMIAGFIVTTIVVGGYLDPYSHTRLLSIFGIVSLVAFCITCLAVWGIEADLKRPVHPAEPGEKANFRASLAQVWTEPKSRQFTVFVFVSMLAFSLQDLILEPFAGLVFSMTPGETTKLAGAQHSGVFVGMLLTGGLGSLLIKRYCDCMRYFCVVGCLLSALALFLLASAASAGSEWFSLNQIVIFLGFGNGMFAVAAIGSMMGLANSGRANREGTRMGIWGAAQAIAFGLGGFLGTVSVDGARFIFADVETAYSLVFAIESLLFLIAAGLASQISVLSLLQPETPAPRIQTNAAVIVGE